MDEQQAHGCHVLARLEPASAGVALSTRCRRTAFGVRSKKMIATLMLVAALLVPVSTGSDECPDVQVIGVRGSGQSEYGEQVRGVVDVLVGRLTATGRSVSEAPLEYPAISVSDSFGLVLLNGGYDASVARGVEALRAVMSETNRTCGRTGIVLVGYSQGSQVIKQAVERFAPNVRITAVALLADPTRDPAQPGVWRLGDPSGEHGGSFGSLALPERLRPITVDVCAAGDWVCERGRFAFRAHTDGYTEIPSVVVDRLMALMENEVVRGPL